MSCRLALSRMTGQVSRFFGDETSPCGGAPAAHRPLNKLEPVEIGPRGCLILDTHRLRAYVPRVRAALRGRFCIYAPASRTVIRGCRPEGKRRARSSPPRTDQRTRDVETR